LPLFLFLFLVGSFSTAHLIPVCDCLQPRGTSLFRALPHLCMHGCSHPPHPHHPLPPLSSLTPSLRSTWTQQQPPLIASWPA
jgi:hypothetical protein